MIRTYDTEGLQTQRLNRLADEGEKISCRLQTYRKNNYNSLPISSRKALTPLQPSKGIIGVVAQWYSARCFVGVLHMTVRIAFF
jgi:hypothetical protein